MHFPLNGYFVCYLELSGLMGKTNMDAFKIEEIQEAVTELFQAFTKIHFESDEAKKVGAFSPSAYELY